MSVKVSIVIVNYNVKELLKSCLNSIFACKNREEIEVIVVDNNSSDGSDEMIKNDFSQVVFIKNNFNAGFSKANNQGMEVAKGEFIFLLNPDTEIYEDAIDELITFGNKSEVSIVAPKLLNSDRSIQYSVWKRPLVFHMLMEAFFLDKLYCFNCCGIESFKSPTEIRTASGAALFFSKSLFTKMGGLDPNLFWMEDIDFCVRAEKFGKNFYLPSSQVVHHIGSSSKKNYHVAIANQLISKLKYFRKHSWFIGFCFACVFCFIQIVSRIFLFTLLSLFREIFRKKLAAYFFTFKSFLGYVFLGKKEIVV